MNTNIKCTDITLSPAILEYTNKRLEKIETLLAHDPSAKCDVELARTTEHHQKGEIFRAEIHIVGAGKDFYASSEEVDLYTAIDRVRDQIVYELTSDKSKKISMLRRSGAKVKGIIKGLWPWGKKI